MNRIGQGIDRVDGRLKVTGQAIFTADVPAEQLAYGVLVSSTIASGRIRRIDTTAAETSPGVVRVFTHLNLPPYPGEAPTPPMNESRLALSDDGVHYVGQYVALVIADSLEQNLRVGLLNVSLNFIA
jgi:xanthine dehydrogenase YagR molybdenum-binding subunit